MLAVYEPKLVAAELAALHGVGPDAFACCANGPAVGAVPPLSGLSVVPVGPNDAWGCGWATVLSPTRP